MFLLGALTGGVIAVVFMCLFQINAPDRRGDDPNEQL
ncbi:MAG: hypothetical protein AWM53_01828 [Candidatus Dichloromethanomonas elyunquensis]|nr:MAG: hypothetical protein AWM53_01828 [Candidatus Dichloromethanomonas elyunquensis]